MDAHDALETEALGNSLFSVFMIAWGQSFGKSWGRASANHLQYDNLLVRKGTGLGVGDEDTIL